MRTQKNLVFSGFLFAAGFLFSTVPAWADDGWQQAFTFPLTANKNDAGRGGIFHDPADNTDYAYFGADTNSGAQVWRSSDGVTWNQVNANGFGTIGVQPIASGISWISTYFDGVSTRVYAGASQNPQVPNNGAQIYRSQGGASANQWTLVFSSATTLDAGGTKDPGGGGAVSFNGALYVGTRNNAVGGEIWKSTSADSTTAWVRVSTAGFGLGPSQVANISYLKVFNGNLFAATNCSVSGPACGQIWKSTGTTLPLGADNWIEVLSATATFDSNTHSVSTLESFNGFLYATTLNVLANHSQVWRTQTPDVPASWQQVFSPDAASGNTFSVVTSSEIHSLRAIGGVLYASTWDTAGLIVYRSTDGATWTRSNAVAGFGNAFNQYVGDFVGIGTMIVGDTLNPPNGGALWSALTTSTQTVPAQPVLAGAAQGISSITWSWGSALNATGYKVLSSTFGNLSNVLSSNTLSFTEQGLVTNTAYTRYVIATDSFGISTSAAVTRFTLADAPTGSIFQGVFGSSITLSWSGNTNPAGTNYQVRLWTVGGATVTTTVAATNAALTSLIGQTTYFLNVEAVNGNGIIAGPDVTLSTVTQTVLVAVATITANGPAQLLAINIPSGAALLSIPAQAYTSTVFLSMQSPGALPAGNASAAGTLLGTGVGVQIDASPSIQPGKLVTITIPYLPANIVGMDPSKLVIARFDTTQSVWVPLESSPNPAAQTVTALSNHLSIFQIMQASPGASISDIKIFPNPFRPALGHQYVTFSNLPANTRIRLYTFSGERVKDLTTDLSGIATWDATNRSGATVASGVYFVFVQGNGGEKTYKVAVQR